MSRQQKPLSERIADADAKGSNWLARGNEYAEAGNKKKADECYEKGQYWLDRSNALQDQRYAEKNR